jgi:hypothetical protein
LPCSDYDNPTECETCEKLDHDKRVIRRIERMLIGAVYFGDKDGFGIKTVMELVRQALRMAKQEREGRE